MNVCIQVCNIYIYVFIWTLIPTSVCYECFLSLPCLPTVYCFRKKNRKKQQQKTYETSYRVAHMLYSITRILISEQYGWKHLQKGVGQAEVQCQRRRKSCDSKEP